MRCYAHAIDSAVLARPPARLPSSSKELFPCFCHDTVDSGRQVAISDLSKLRVLNKSPCFSVYIELRFFSLAWAKM